MPTGSEPGLIWRLAGPADIPHIVELLREFYADREELFEIPFDLASTVASVREILSTGVCVVGPTSCAGATFHPFIVNHGVRVAFVQFWYFREARELLIFDVLVDECKRLGATHVTAASHAPEFTIGRLYGRRGMEPKELHFMRAL